MTKNVLAIALCAIGLACIPRPGVALDRYAHTAAVARAEATAALESAGVFSLTTAVMVDGRIVYAEAFGMIGDDRSTPANIDTQFNAGSISKVFTAVAILRLRDQGRIDLDKPVVHYLPHFRMNDARYRRITLRTLLDHTAGVPGTNYYKLFGAKGNSTYIAETLALLRDSQLKSSPGDINVYCNDCFTVASAVIERVSGMSFEDFVRREIFVKARMNNSSYSFKPGNRNIATIYDPDTQEDPLPPEHVNARGTGGLTTTAVDLCRFSRALFDGELLSPRSLRELQKRQAGRLGSGVTLSDAGLGWDSVVEPGFAAQGVRVLAKDGFTIFFRSQLYAAPEEDVTAVTVLAGPAALSGSVVIEMNKKIMRAALGDKGVLPSPGISPPSPTRSAAIIPEALLGYAGIYGTGHSITNFTFDSTANALESARLVDGVFVPGTTFYYKDNGRFYVVGDPNSYSFTLANDGRKLLLQHVNDGQSVATLGESIHPDKGKDTSAFEDTTWVPRNLRAFDFVTLLYKGIYKTGSINALPGIVYLHAGNPGDATAYGLTNKYTTRMILPYVEDQFDVGIVYDAGAKVLKAGAFEFTDAAAAPPLQPGERIVIGADGYNVARRVTRETSFMSSIPAGGRIVIYAPDGATAFDSLFMENGAMQVSPGSFVVFIGDPRAVFRRS